MPRSNGCEPPFHFKLVLTTIHVLACIIFYPSVSYTLIEYTTSMIPFLIVLLTPCLIATFFFLIASTAALMYSNPADKGLSKRHEAEAPDVESGQSTLYWCEICQVCVDRDSLHCRSCDKCVHRLDHHCFFVNNCIGKSNYRIYVVVLGMAFLFCFCSVFMSCLFLGDGVLRVDGNNIKLIVAIIFSVILGLVSLTGLGFIGNLICLHIRLYKRKETTLEYSRYLRDKYLATLELKSGAAKSAKSGFWGLFSKNSKKKNSLDASIVPETDNIDRLQDPTIIGDSETDQPGTGQHISLDLGD